MAKGCKDFFNHLGSAQMLLGEIVSIQDEMAIKEMTPEERDRFLKEKLIPVAKKYGFDFTVEEMDDFIDEMINPYDIPEASLEMVRHPQSLVEALHKMMSRQ